MLYDQNATWLNCIFGHIVAGIAVLLLLFCLHLPISAEQDAMFVHWPFDEVKNAAAATNSVDAARYAVPLEGTVPGERGVFGNALELQGNRLRGC